MLTTFDADDMVVQALRAGAHGFLLKDTEPRRLVEAVRLVAAGEPILSPSVTATLIAHVATGGGAVDASDRRRTDAETLLATLTDREREVALAIGRGLSNADISRELYLVGADRQGPRVARPRQARRRQPGPDRHRRPRRRPHLTLSV